MSRSELTFSVVNPTGLVANVIDPTLPPPPPSQPPPPWLCGYPGYLASARHHALGELNIKSAAYGVSRLQSINNSTQVALTLNGQQAGKNLDSSEKFSLGGISGVRAYPQGEASGDEGLKATLELRHSYSANWQITAFYDAGTVKTNKNPFGVAGAANSKSLSGAGFGINANFDKVQLKVALAWRTSGGAPASLPAELAKSPVLIVAATVGF